MKKKLMAIGLIITMVLGVTGCGDKASENNALVKNNVTQNSDKSDGVDTSGNASKDEETVKSFPEVEPFAQPLSETIDNEAECFLIEDDMFAVYMDKNTNLEFPAKYNDKYEITDDTIGVSMSYKDDSINFDGYMHITRFGANSKKNEIVTRSYYEKEAVMNNYNVKILVIDKSVGSDNKINVYYDLALLDPDISSEHLRFSAEISEIEFEGSEAVVNEVGKKIISAIKGIKYIGDENSIKPTLHGKYAKLEYITKDGTAIAMNIGGDVTELYKYVNKHQDDFEFTEALDTTVEPGETLKTYDIEAGLTIEVINNTESTKVLYECELYSVTIYQYNENMESSFKLNGVDKEDITYEMIEDYYRKVDQYSDNRFTWKNNYGNGSSITFDVENGKTAENICEIRIWERWNETEGIDYVAD